MIKYRLKLIKSKGQVEAKEILLAGPSSIVGRGENADIRFEDPLISFRHAELLESHDGIRISDLNSFSGTRVNNKPIQRDMLQDGDIISIGLYSIEVKREGADWILVEERRLDKAKGEEEFIASTLKSASFRDNLPSMTLLSIILATIILFLYFYIPLTTPIKGSWSSGPISNEHKLLANDCKACHAVPFEKVSNNTCKECHKMNDHRMDLHAGQTLDSLACTNCHTEHNGSAGLIIKEELLCTSCHGDLSNLLDRPTKVENVHNFNSHPDFKIHLFLQNEKTPLKGAKDTNTLKLNHEIHLKGAINGPDREEQLDCASCHKLSEDKRTFKSVNFETSCERCHTLGFSKPHPEVMAPHTNPDDVFLFLLRFYANESLLKEGQKSSSEDKRFIPGNLDKRSLELFFLRKDVVDNARKAEHELFTKLSCSVCHEVKKLENPLTEDKSIFKITPPEQRVSWFPSVLFDHSSHQNVLCKDCHRGVFKSELTSEVLIPDVNSCRECHGDQGHTDKVSSTCISCHPYHQTEQEKAQMKNDIE